VIEVYWTWTFFGGLLLTPSVQVIVDPALNPAKSSVSVLSLRATFTF
jgi:carbohydrate-selective porin OprB